MSRAPDRDGRALGAAADLRFEESVAEFCAHVSSLGLDHVELKREYLLAPPEGPSAERIGAIADEHGVSLTLHAPFRDCNLGSFNDASREAAVAQVCATLDDAATAGAGAVVVHGGSVRRHYPERVRAKARRGAIRSLRECAAHAAEVGVPLCLENQPRSATKSRHTGSPDALAAVLDEVGADPAALGVTLDVGHATVNGHDWRAFVDRFGDRIEVVHLHDNDGTADDHEPFPGYEPVVDAVDAPYNVFEMKRVADVARCLDGSG